MEGHNLTFTSSTLCAAGQDGAVCQANSTKAITDQGDTNPTSSSSFQELFSMRGDQGDSGGSLLVGGVLVGVASAGTVGGCQKVGCWHKLLLLCQLIFEQLNMFF